MQCPACKTTTLVMTERQGIEIDYCPECRGVWLDRGELDKLIERASAQADAPAAARAPEPPRQVYREPEQRYSEHRSHHPSQGYPPRKRKGLLGELFDFD